MKKLFQPLILFGLVLVFFTTVFAKSGPPIPIPQVSITEAITLAQDYFSNEEKRIVDVELFKRKDYLLYSVRYTSNFNGELDKEWAWEVKFIHPLQNDHSVAYKVTNDRKIILLYASE
jgi:hypothetical protein